MIWTSTLQIWKHEYFGDLDFIILFVGILSMYAINLGAVSLFADSLFTFLAMFVSDVLYRFEWMNIVFCFCQKKKNSYTYPKIDISTIDITRYNLIILKYWFSLLWFNILFYYLNCTYQTNLFSLTKTFFTIFVTYFLSMFLFVWVFCYIHLFRCLVTINLLWKMSYLHSFRLFL